MAETHANDEGIGIGAVSRATGIPESTLRTWEQRYGFPDPDRNAAGHRRYDPEVVDRLRTIERLLEQGYRASDVVAAPPERLEELRETTSTEPLDSDWRETWLDATRASNTDQLTAYFRRTWNRLGALEFLTERAAPFVRNVGDAWASDEIAVRHEHVASEVLREFLSSRWRAMSPDDDAPRAVCATVPGERHVLGLHFAATVLALAGWEVLFVGGDTPTDDLAEMADDADALALSFAAGFSPDSARETLASLAGDLPETADLLVGGDGAPSKLPVGRQFDDLEALCEWASRRTG